MATSARKRHFGITMVEMCMVLVIGGILAGLAIPSLVKLRRHQQLKGVAQTVATDIQQARSEAVRRGDNVQLRFSEHPGGYCYIIHTGASGQCRCQDSAEALCTGTAAVLKLEWVPSARQMTVRTGGSNKNFNFDPRMGTVSPGGRVLVTNVDGENISHVISVMGRIHTCTTTRTKNSLPECDEKKKK